MLVVPAGVADAGVLAVPTEAAVAGALAVGVALVGVLAVGVAGFDWVAIDSQPTRPSDSNSAPSSARRGIETPFEVIIERAQFHFPIQTTTKTQGNSDLATVGRGGFGVRGSGKTEVREILNLLNPEPSARIFRK
jgi:hypothetical protein